MRRRLANYRRRLLDGPWQLQGCTAEDFAGAVVIPACGERQSLPLTLAALAANPVEDLRRWLVVVVVNQPPPAAPSLLAENLQTLAWLEAGGAPSSLHLTWVDAARSGQMLPEKDAGVGLARKLGCDLALPRLRPDGCGLLAWLDADTLVDNNYLAVLETHFAAHAQGGTTIPFAHQPADSQAAQWAIDRYELYLRHYVYGLRLAGSPYAYHSIGSTIAFRAEAYLAIGGMNRRQAGEDFYFLQQLAKTCGVRPLTGTLVRPSARRSQRVPFGTGEKVARLAAGEAAVSFYPAENFRILKTWLQIVSRHSAADASELLNRIESRSGSAAEFLRDAGFPAIWPKLVARNHSPEKLLRAFHGWFDALKTLRLIRHLGSFSADDETSGLVAELITWGKGSAPREIERQLALLRRLQGVVSGGTREQSCAMLCSVANRERL